MSSYLMSTSGIVTGGVPAACRRTPSDVMMALDLLSLIHQLDDLVQFLSEEPNHVVRGDDANEGSVVVDDGKTANAALLHLLDCVGQTRVLMRGQETVVDHV